MSKLPQLMGILNTTPDSFYDQGKYFKLEAAIEKGKQLFNEGADILDIGGESTRPGAPPVTAQEELARVIPVIQALHHQIPIPLSIDTYKPPIAAAALAAGAQMINDVTGFRNPAMQEIAVSANVPICVMHMLGTPQIMQQSPSYPEGVIPHLLHFFEQQIELLMKRGIKENNIILDPGIGFGKTVDDNLKIIQNLPILKAMGFPLLLGVSRKSFMGKILNKSACDLLPATIAINTVLIMAGVEIIRVHDVCEHRAVIDLISKVHVQS